MQTDTYAPSVTFNAIRNSSPYSDEQRREAVIQYLSCGKYSITSERTGIPLSTIRDWRESEWWDDVAASVRTAVEDETRAKLSAITHEALDKTLSALTDGEQHMTRHGPVTLPVKAKDAMLIAAMAYDKLRLSLNLPGRITDTGRVDSLADQLAKLSAQVNATVVSEQ